VHDPSFRARPICLLRDPIELPAEWLMRRDQACAFWAQRTAPSCHPRYRSPMAAVLLDYSSSWAVAGSGG
jgi:hypothetical protein